ncbi:MAG: hypothetical protein GC165_13925 [Armatimonadetes bacterium]|nr:hypothetical protein [Armatimonadota bacterium]MBS1725826.1 hypothetical protein [Armatimonadota bacterium]
MDFFNPDISSPTGSPQGMMEILIVPLIFSFFGVMMFIGAYRYEANYDKEAKWWKWCFAPLGIAILLGIQRVSFLRSFAYVETVLSRKALWSHYAALIIPILCTVGVALYKVRKKRQEERRVY